MICFIDFEVNKAAVAYEIKLFNFQNDACEAFKK